MHTALANLSPMASGPSIPESQLESWRALLNAHAALTREIDAALAAAGLPALAWYDVLWPLYRAPGRRLRMGELAEQVVTISRTGLTRLVDRVEEAGLLRREACPNDRRGTDVVLTDDGRKMLRRMWPVYARVVQEAFVSALTKEESAVIREALERVRERARELERMRRS